MNLAQTFRHAVGWVFPCVCQFCGELKAGPDESFICGRCRSRPKAIQYISEPICAFCGLPYPGAITTEFVCANCTELELNFTSARAAAAYSGLVKEVIHRFKYSRQEWNENFLASLLIGSALPILRENPVDIIAPIPLFPKRERARGFNQAARLGKRLADAAEIAFEPHLLERIRDTGPQASLDRDDRKANVKGAFRYTGTERLAFSRVLLIDDVLTTGLTASECAGELLKNGAMEARVWTVARGGLNQ